MNHNTSSAALQHCIASVSRGGGESMLWEPLGAGIVFGAQQLPLCCPTEQPTPYSICMVHSLTR